MGDAPSRMKERGNIFYTVGQDQQRVAHASWYRGEHCNHHASKINLGEADAAEQYVLKGWLPRKPFITRQHCITSFGSCFAQHLSHYLIRQGYMTGVMLARRMHRSYLNIFNSHVIRFGEGMVNTFALRQQFDWAYEGKEFSEDLWYGSAGELAPYIEETRLVTKEIFEITDVFVITLGLSEVWCNKKTGEVFWRAIPQDKFDPAVHGFRVSNCDENRENLAAIVETIRRHRPHAKIIFTLSPIPLVATFRPVSCISANSVSKGILRVALDELMRTNEDDDIYYWPSYELIKEYYADPYEEDNRHVKQDVIDSVMELFRQHYLVDGYDPREVSRRRSAILAMITAKRNVSGDVAERMYQWGVQSEADIMEYEEFQRQLRER